MNAIAFASIKGGTGKSSLAILIENMLAQRRYRVLVIDMDVQNRATFYYLENPHGVEQRNIARALQSQTVEPNVLPTRWADAVAELDFRVVTYIVFDLVPESRVIADLFAGAADSRC